MQHHRLISGQLRNRCFCHHTLLIKPLVKLLYHTFTGMQYRDLSGLVGLAKAGKRKRKALQAQWDERQRELQDQHHGDVAPLAQGGDVVALGRIMGRIMHEHFRTLMQEQQWRVFTMRLNKNNKTKTKKQKTKKQKN